ncbi:PDZ domain-containing protein [Planctomycetaceae bacterium SH139]
MKFAPTPTHRKRLSLLLRRCSAGIDMTSQPIYRDQYGRQYTPQYGGQQFGGQQFGGPAVWRASSLAGQQFGGQAAGSRGQEKVVTPFNLKGQPYRVRIGHRDGARLEISMTSEEEQVKIQNVARGSATAAAGLRSGDIIVTANGRQINAPQNLIDIVDQRSPGDELDLTVKRDSEQQKLTAKLQSFASDQRSMARPRMDGGDNMQMINQLQQEVRQLSQQVEELSKMVESMSKEGGASGQANR